MAWRGGTKEAAFQLDKGMKKKAAAGRENSFAKHTKALSRILFRDTRNPKEKKKLQCCFLAFRKQLFDFEKTWGDIKTKAKAFEVRVPNRLLMH